MSKKTIYRSKKELKFGFCRGIFPLLRMWILSKLGFRSTASDLVLRKNIQFSPAPSAVNLCSYSSGSRSDREGVTTFGTRKISLEENSARPPQKLWRTPCPLKFSNVLLKDISPRIYFKGS